MINSAVSFSAASSKEVNAFNALPHQSKTASHWEQDSVDAVRKEIKQFYIRKQTYRCCYCEQAIRSRHGRMWDVEHVVSRSTHPQFMFEPRNLAVACIDCNTAKGNSPVLASSNPPAYPLSSDAFVICHPHFDSLFEHILVLFERFYIPKSQKGRKTIEVCGLLRYAFEHADWDAGIADNDRLRKSFERAMNATDENQMNTSIMEALVLCGLQVVRRP